MQQDKHRRYLRFLGAKPDADVDDEIAFHLEMRAKELMARGMEPGQAREEARRRFGDRARVEAEMRRMERERTRKATRLASFRDLRGDVTFIIRSLVRQPLFTISAILTLGLSIGVNTSIFSAVSAYLLRPLPVRDADRLALVALATKKDNLIGNMSYPMFREVAKLPVFEDALAWAGVEVALRSQKEPTRGFMLAGSGNYLSMLGVRPALGRVFTSQDADTRAPVVVLSDAYWKREFNRDPTVVGRTLFMNEIPFTVIGVTAPEFRGTQQLIVPDGYLALDAVALFDPTMRGNMENISFGGFRMMAHIGKGVTLQQARAALTQLSDEITALYPAEMADTRLVMERELRTRPEYAVSRLTPWVAWTFFGMVGLALLVACANVANLLLARATARRSELALRSALGASPGRVIRLLLTESLLLGAASLVVASLLARFSIRWLSSRPLEVDVPIDFGLTLDWSVFWYAAAISLLAGVLAGVVPAVLGSRTPVGEVLREGGRTGTAGRRRTRLRSGLIVAQVAVSFVLLVCGALFIRAARSAAHLDLGFDRERLLLAVTDLSLHRIAPDARRGVQDRILQGLAALPTVERVALGTSVPLSGNFNTRTLFVEERPPQAPEGFLSSGTTSITPSYLVTLGLKLMGGRDFTPQDDSGAPRVAIVNQALAAALWPGREPVGQRLRTVKDGPLVEVVGVVANAQYLLLGELPRPFLYLPLRQDPGPYTFIVIRTRAQDPSTVTADLRRAVAAVNPALLVYGVRSMAAHLDHGIALFFVNIGATLATAIGLLGLLQTIVGLYGVLSYSVAQRSREIGIKLALGARPGVVVAEVLRQGSVLVGIGLALGGVLAFALTRVLGSMLYGVSPTDGLAFGGSVVLVGTLALLSSYIPAWRASRVAPATAIRSE